MWRYIVENNMEQREKAVKRSGEELEKGRKYRQVNIEEEM